MSNVRYKKTSKKEDKEVLTFEDELADEYEHVENENGTSEPKPHQELNGGINKDDQAHTSSSMNGRISDGEFEDDDDDEHHFPHTPPPPTMVPSCYMWWAIFSTTLLVALILIAIFAHPKKRNINWCCIDDQELARCQDMSIYFYGDGFRPKIECKSAPSIDECVRMIDHDVADVINLSADDLFKYRSKVRPILAADYDHEMYGFYSVAVVHKDSTITNLTAASLKSSLACVADMHSVGSLVPRSSESECLAPHEVVTALFSQTCSPALAQQQQSGFNSDVFCSGCQSKCSQPCAHNDHCGYTGAMKCLTDAVDGSNTDVIAFTNHIDAKNYLNRSSSHNASDYRIVCPDGRRHNLDGFKSCNVGFVPSYALAISSKGRADDDTDIPYDLVELLYIAQLYFGQHTTDAFRMYDMSKNNYTSIDGFRDPIFQGKTTKLAPLWFWMHCTVEAYLGEDYLDFLTNLNCLPKPEGSTAVCHIPTTTQT